MKQQKLIVVIHHLAAFLEQYEEYENLLYKLARDGARYGIYVWLSAISLQDVRFRLQSQFSNIFVFQMHDESDISSIIGEHRRMPTIFGRALWKNQEVYEVQMAYSDITSYIQNLIVDETALHLCHLDVHVDCKEIWRLYQPDHSLIIPIGMDKLQRTPCTISLQEPWIVSGSGAPSFCRELKNLLAPRNDQMIDEHDLKRQEFQMKSGICYLSPSFLVANSYATWMQSLLEDKHLLWIGEGIEEVSYVLHLPSSLEAVSGMDGYVIEKEITAVRFMEDV